MGLKKYFLVTHEVWPRWHSSSDYKSKRYCMAQRRLFIQNNSTKCSLLSIPLVNNKVVKPRNMNVVLMSKMLWNETIKNKPLREEKFFSFTRPAAHFCTLLRSYLTMIRICQSQWPRGLKCGSASARVLRSRVWNLPRHGCLSLVSFVCYRAEISMWTDHLSRGILSTVVRLWSRSLDNEELMPH